MTKLFIALIGVFVLAGLCVGYLSWSSLTTTVADDSIDYLQHIPAKPDNFDLTVRELNSLYMDFCALSEDYYLQPEFYGDSWTRGRYFYDDHDYERWAVHGHGAFPGNPTFEFGTPIKGAWISDCLIYRTGWGIETYQGIRLVPEESEYFDITITPDEFLLPPTYPVFSDDWAKKITINVSTKETPPSGKYVFVVNTVSPRTESSKIWYREIFSEEMIKEHQIMIDECIQQGGSNCEELIEVERRNKYIDGSTFQMGSRIIITIIVKT